MSIESIHSNRVLLLLYFLCVFPFATCEIYYFSEFAYMALLAVVSTKKIPNIVYFY